MSARTEHATRLLKQADERIECNGPAIGFTVDDHYEVTVGDLFASCTCPARTRCYHIDACAELVKRAATERSAA